jgi:hypothetical protein
MGSAVSLGRNKGTTWNLLQWSGQIAEVPDLSFLSLGGKEMDMALVRLCAYTKSLLVFKPLRSPQGSFCDQAHASWPCMFFGWQHYILSEQ